MGYFIMEFFLSPGHYELLYAKQLCEGSLKGGSFLSGSFATHTQMLGGNVASQK